MDLDLDMDWGDVVVFLYNATTQNSLTDAPFKLDAVLSIPTNVVMEFVTLVLEESALLLPTVPKRNAANPQLTDAI
jgi:hypothetical protein